MEIIRVPKLNENMDTAMVGRWRVREGDVIRPGDIMVDLVTDKASIEVRAESEGILLAAVAAEKSSVPVGYIIAVIGNDSESTPDIAAENAAIREQYISGVSDIGTPLSRRKIKATPAARRLAEESGIDLSDIVESIGTWRTVDRKTVERFIREEA